MTTAVVLANYFSTLSATTMPIYSMPTHIPTSTQQPLPPIPTTPTGTPFPPVLTTTPPPVPLIDDGTILYQTDGYPVDFVWSTTDNHLIIAAPGILTPGYLVEMALDTMTIVREDQVSMFATGHIGCFGAFNSDASILAFAPEQYVQPTLRVWDVRQRRTIQVLSDPSHEISCVAWSPDDQTLISAGIDQIVFWDTTSWIASDVYPVEDNRWAASVAWSPDGTLIAFGRPDGIDIWDSESHQAIRTLAGPTVISRSVAFSPDGRWLASGDDDGHVWIWSVTEGSATYTFDASSSVRDVVWSPDGSMIAAGTLLSQAYIWEVSSGTLLRTITDSSGGLNALTWSPDATLLITGARDITVWQVPR